MLDLTFVLQVRAVKNMEKGEEVTQSYLTGKLCTRYILAGPSCCFQAVHHQGGEAGNLQEQVGLHLRLQALQPAAQ